MNNNYNNDHKYYNAFNLIPQMGPLRFERLCNYFDTIKGAWDANSEEYKRAGLEKNVTEKIIQLKKWLASLILTQIRMMIHRLFQMRLGN